MRFIFLAIPATVLGLALFHFAWEALGLGLGVNLPARLELGTWLLESVGLTTLYLLLRGAAPSPGKSRWLDGLMTGWIAWVFRGPALVLSLGAAGALPAQPGWVAAGWLVAYSICGLVLVALARRMEG
ncbi:MAG: hypothetical protein K0U98_22095 [Deltaproteobacteria bacterium]|nr:hypothetical protein [Deltaproteobacteria bacterium]